MIHIFNENREYIGSRELPLQEGETFLYSENEIVGSSDGLKIGLDGSYIYAEVVIQVPLSVSRMGLKIQLLLKGITITDIIDTINSIPSYMFPQQQKQIAIIKFEEAAFFDRYNADLQLIATLIGLTQDDLDEIFINGNKIT